MQDIITALRDAGLSVFSLEEIERMMKDFETEAAELACQRGIGIGAARELVRQRRLRARLAPAAEEQVRFCGIAAHSDPSSAGSEGGV